MESRIIFSIGADALIINNTITIRAPLWLLLAIVNRCRATARNSVLALKLQRGGGGDNGNATANDDNSQFNVQVLLVLQFQLTLESLSLIMQIHCCNLRMILCLFVVHQIR